MLNNKNKFRFWNPQAKGFVTNYKYNGLVDELFDQDDFLYPLAEKICYCLGLKKEWDVHQEGLDKLHKLIFGEDAKKD